MRQLVSWIKQNSYWINLPFYVAVCADPVLLKGRNLTCAHNIICDVKYGDVNIATSSNQNVNTHNNGFLVTAKHAGAVDRFNDIFLECLAEIK